MNLSRQLCTTSTWVLLSTALTFPTLITATFISIVPAFADGLKILDTIDPSTVVTHTNTDVIKTTADGAALSNADFNAAVEYVSDVLGTGTRTVQNTRQGNAGGASSWIAMPIFISDECMRESLVFEETDSDEE